MAKKPPTPGVVFDTGPAERRQHNTVVLEQGANMRGRLRVVDQTEIDRLLHKRLISLDQHTAGEHLYRDVQAAGYVPACKWAMDSNIRGEVQSVSDRRAIALLKINLGRAWLISKAGRGTTEYLFGVILGEREVPEKYLPAIRTGLDKYQSFEGWWHGRDVDVPLPKLLGDMPRTVRVRSVLH